MVSKLDWRLILVWVHWESEWCHPVGVHPSQYPRMNASKRLEKTLEV